MRVQKEILACASLAIGLIAGNASAQTFTTAPLGNDESQIVKTGGAVISAANFGAASSGTQTVDINGITHFVASATNNGDGGENLPELTILSSFDGHYRDAQSTNAGYTGDMQNLMAGIAGTASSPFLDFFIDGLTPGTEYLLQMYWEANEFNQVIRVGFEDGTTFYEGITSNGSDGLLISYTFTANDNDLLVGWHKSGGNDNPWLQGYSLQEAVPEPGSLALIGLGGAILMRRRR